MVAIHDGIDWGTTVSVVTQVECEHVVFECDTRIIVKAVRKEGKSFGAW